jgi:acetylornithine/N-succinyldiaminopimelate aminotransferase
VSVTTVEIPPVKAQPTTATSDVAQTSATSAQQSPYAGAAVEALVETDAKAGIQNYGRLQLAFTRGAGAHLWDSAGKQYLDFLGGIAVVTVGHCHPAVTEAISRQAATMVHSSNLYYIEPQVHLAARLHELSGGMRAFFCNSGAEANEAALKIARKYVKTKQPHNPTDEDRFEIITAVDSFHGRTYASLAATGQPKYHEGFEPMPSGFRYVPLNDVAALEAAITENTAAIMLEPIQGESGIRPCSDGYLQAARALCDKHGLLLIFDEVQCGMGRTGRFFAHEWAGVRADIVTMAKGLGNGVPIGTMLATEEVAAAFSPGTHGCTFGGNFLSCAAALATLDVVRDEGLMENAVRVGDYFQQKLREWGDKHSVVEEVRGRGLMIGVQLSRPVARDIMKASLERGLIFNAVGDLVMRFLPPLNITTSDVDEAIAVLDAAVQQVDAKAVAS